MDIGIIDKYNEFNDILSGCRSILDAHYFANIYTKKYPAMKQLINSMINGKKYENVIDMKTMKLTLESINNYEYVEDAQNIINGHAGVIVDATQKHTFDRMTKDKPHRPINIVKEIIHTNQQNVRKECDHCIFSVNVDCNLIQKKCPHCKHFYFGNADDDYVICGFYNNKVGNDMHGCEKDWCFRCEKKLCKSWKEHELFVLSNRYHNSECCSQHATEHNNKYPDDYCQCINLNVMRF